MNTEQQQQDAIRAARMDASVERYNAARVVFSEDEIRNTPACAGCLLPKYDSDYIGVMIDDASWKQISPKPNGDGSLCLRCVVNRLKMAGIEAKRFWLYSCMPLRNSEYGPALETSVSEVKA